MTPERKKKIESEALEAANRLADWIVNAHGGQDWEVKIDECSEPAAAALGVPHEAFRALVAKYVEKRRDAGADQKPQIRRRDP